MTGTSVHGGRERGGSNGSERERVKGKSDSMQAATSVFPALHPLLPNAALDRHSILVVVTALSASQDALLVVTPRDRNKMCAHRRANDQMC
eukprot:637407-Rhodomonas_salina.1